MPAVRVRTLGAPPCLAHPRHKTSALVCAHPDVFAAICVSVQTISARGRSRKLGRGLRFVDDWVSRRRVPGTVAAVAAGLSDDAEAGAAPFVPRTTSLQRLAAASQGCRGCPLYRDTTQTVFGEGDRSAPLMLVGEQPGDIEDRRGHVFVGPSGFVLWRCVHEAGIDRADVYATNAVKHFKHEMRGKRRLHKKPNTDEIEACHPWLTAELDVLGPSVIVALGATAARSILGRAVPIAASRGTPFELDGRPVVVTYHPSAVLRADERAEEVRAALVDDLRHARHMVG